MLTTASSIGGPVTAENSRQLLSGVEVIPGFTGAKCGSYTYMKYTVALKDPSGTPKPVTLELGQRPDGNADDKTKISQAAYDANGGAYAQWEADSGGIVYVILSIWLFLGIAIICDEQFTQSLNMICSRFGINMDENVAGATFMAAGSSAPELATSFLGTFVAASPVGLGTILGSAVFNILIIVGAVAFLSKKALDLDFRPVLRDNFFYAISVILLCILLAIDDEANLIDSIILLLWYVAYIVYLAYDKEMTAILFPHPEKQDHGVPSEPEAGEGELASPISQGGSVVSMGDSEAIELEVNNEGEGAPAEEGAPTGTGKGAGDAAPAEEAAEADAPAEEDAAEAPASEEAEEKADHKNSVGLVDSIEEGDSALDMAYFIFGSPFIYLYKYTMPDCEHPLLDEDDDEEEDEDGEEKEDVPLDDKPDCDLTNDQLTERWNNMYDAADYVGPVEFPTEIIMEYEEGEDGEQVLTGRVASVVGGCEHRFTSKVRMLHEAKESLQGGQRWYWATFFISLLHITWISYFMVEFMLKIGCIWGIPDVVMGLTFLAMGTSIPDALGSVAVAQSGKGDMAVSNAVGSNVFDICIGLGLPWFIKLAIKAGDTCDHIPIWQASKDVIPSIIILLVIIVVLFSVFVAGEWKLYPWTGYVLFGVYGLFIIYQLLNTYVINKDPKPCDLFCCYN